MLHLRAQEFRLLSRVAVSSRGADSGIADWVDRCGELKSGELIVHF